LSKKPRESFAAGAAKENQIIFSGDMCVGENTSRACKRASCAPLAHNKCVAAGRNLLEKVAKPLF
jgi:hypothetical protein